MQILPGDLRVGSIVRVRRARWRILDVRSYERCQIVTLGGVTPPNRTRRVVAPFDRLEPVGVRRRRLRIVGARAWRRACRALLAADSPPRGLRTAAAARIDLLPHQFEPAMAVTEGRASRILLADDVGLGKTIQAGLVITELLARGAVDRVLILTPAGLRDQWRHELRRRFALDAIVVDARAVARLAASLPPDVSPWATIPIAIASIEFVKRPEVLPAIDAARWDLVIVDEAHGVATAADRHAAADVLCSRAAYVAAITATPHSGDDNAYESLCRLGSTGDPLIIFRRTRRDVGCASRRRIHVIGVRRSPDERRMDSALTAYSDAVRRERDDAWLALSVLHKRALSSAWSLAESVERRIRTITCDDAAGPAQMALPLVDSDGDFTPEDQPPLWPADLSLADAALERGLLTGLALAARQASLRESKITALVRLLRRVDDRVIVFTEYRDTLEHVRRAVGSRAITLHGGMSRDHRAAALDRFARAAGAVLLATDAAGEGLNLQEACRFVVNLELPWNPMRLEQRIGRVDRIGQRRAVHASHLVARETGEAAILGRLRERLSAAKAAIDVPDPLGGRDEELRLARLVVTGDADDRPPPRHAPTRGRPVDAAAEAEAQRVAELRRAGAVPGPLPHEGALPMLVSRRSGTRRALGRDVLMLWRMVAEDVAGAIVVERVAPVRVSGFGPPPPCSRAQLGSFIGGLAAAVRPRIADATARWREESTAADAAFRSMRLRRERAIARRAESTPSAEYQAGLFDQRAVRARAAADALGSAAADDSAERIARFARSIAHWSIELALVAIGR
jgi:superfamily II DNA or RNA helicase